MEEGPRGALDYTVARFLVNYRPVDRMVRDRVRLSDAAGVTGNAHRFAGKIVLLGTADPEDAQENSFVPPGYRRAYPGVYFHAAAANTLLQRPVHELTHLGRLLLDFGLSVLVFGAMAGIQIFYSGRSLAGLRVHRLERIVSAAGMVAAFVIGVLWVDRTRVMWDDYLIVFVAALVHRHVEPLYHALRRGWRRVAFRAAGETET